MQKCTYIPKVLIKTRNPLVINYPKYMLPKINAVRQVTAVTMVGNQMSSDDNL